MKSFATSTFLVVALAGVSTTLAQTFSLACNTYPDVCDNYANAVLCHGITGPLHYDATSDSGTGDQRRTAVGCGARNYCGQAAPGSQCDEYPYASTYDGGLGCYPEGYDGRDHLLQSGTTRCAIGAQNAAHGQALGQFYSRVLHFDNGKPFLIGWQNDQRGPLGELIRRQGTRACPNDSTGIYRFRSTPATPSCPGRHSLDLDFGAGPGDLEVSIRTLTTAIGLNVTVPYVEGRDDLSLFAVGSDVFTHDVDGNAIMDTIAAVSQLRGAGLKMVLQ